MINLAIILLITGSVLYLVIWLWSRRATSTRLKTQSELMLESLPQSNANGAILIASLHGKLIYANERAQKWFKLRIDNLSLERAATVVTPKDAFYSLFRGDNDQEVYFRIENRFVEAFSYRVPSKDDIQIVVMVRETVAQNQMLDSQPVLDVALVVDIVNKINENINASFGTEQILQSILTIIGDALGNDAGEISLWDEAQSLLYQRGWVGDASYILALALAGGYYGFGEGIPGFVARRQEPLLVADIWSSDAIKPKPVGKPICLFCLNSADNRRSFSRCLDNQQSCAGFAIPCTLGTVRSA